MTHPFEEFLRDIQRHPNAISASAYDMAWLAWLMPSAREWLCDAQRPDGSWGAELEYFHDRVVSTLSAINALAATATNNHDLRRIERGIRYLEKAALALPRDPTETVGFELLAPALLQMGQHLGLKLDRVACALEPYRVVQQQKLALIPPAMLYNPQCTAPHSLEFIGFDGLDRSAIDSLRFANGSIHDSPAATAFCEVAGAGSPKGRDYLSSVLEYHQGTVPNVAPFEVYEINWALLHLYLAEDLTQFREVVQPLLDKVKAIWGPEGLGITREFPPDLDNTAATYTLLSSFGDTPDLAALEVYEEPDHFRCYRYERNISLDVHTHLVLALRQAPDFPRRDDMLLKAINILERYLQGVFITDKWHVSPYYSTGHAVIALHGLIADHLIQNQINWLCDSQRADGSWTFYPSCPTAAIEETAHALLALLVVQERTGSIPHDTIKRGMEFLVTHYHSHADLPALWVEKTIYHPMHITQSIFLATFALYQQLYCQRI
jgi:halimadienyl-diphosphate synthase